MYISNKADHEFFKYNSKEHILFEKVILCQLNIKANFT